MMKLWGGRFSQETNALVNDFNTSLSFDIRLYHEDITASLAWAEALTRAGVLSQVENKSLADGLEQVREEIRDETITITADDEDIHTLVERRLTELVGPLAGKLHTGRSRNDQVATDFRLWTMDAIDQLINHIHSLREVLLDSARSNLNLPMPGYTHLQHAQPVTWGHWILSHFWPLSRDKRRLLQAKKATSFLPLGSGALAGSSVPVDRWHLAELLGFDDICQNSIDAVSDRDFAVEFLFTTTVVALHLSRLAEQLIIFSSSEFGFVQLDDAYSTGSSLMPQKRNPDPLELTRAKSGRLIGNLTGLLATFKGLPSAYDKDLQEDKEPAFDAFDSLNTTLPVMTGLIKTMRLRPEKIVAQLDASLYATDLADYLVKKGVPFRKAHGIIGRAVQMAEDQKIPLSELSSEDLKGISHLFEGDIKSLFTVTTSLESRSVLGGTSSDALEIQLKAAEKSLSN
jgi:argininosuccinate lyase